MHTPYATQSQASLFFAYPDATDDSPVDGLPKASSSRPWPLNIYTEDHDDDGLPSTSQSWPPASDFATRPSFGAAGEELEVPDDENLAHASPAPLDSSTDFPWSPAAAFLSSFTPSCPAPLAPDASNQTIAGYVLGPTIGHGGFSTIKEATSSSGGVVAIKIVRHSAFATLPPSEKAWQRSRLSHEARVWVSLSHENILPLFDSHRTSEATYLITLFCPAGSLLDILKREGTPALEQTDAGCMFRQVVKALQYLHDSVGLVHGDVKLENVLVDESGVCRLADFGLARRIGGDSSQVSSEDEDEEPPKRDRSRGRRTGTSALPVHLSLMRHGPQRHRNSAPLPASATPPTHPDHMFQPGSLPYAAPELLLPHAHSHSGDAVHGHGSRPIAHPAQDMWALGVLLYALLTGSLPFRDAFEPRLQMKILRGTYVMPPAIGPLAESVLKGCLERDVGERWTIAMVDNAAWGIGYGNVDLDPVICEEQRSQSQSRSQSRPPPLHSHPFSPSPPPSVLDLPASMSSCSIASSAPLHTPVARGRPPRVEIRSQSRSPSPSVVPRTPDDDEGGTFFGGRRRLPRLPRDESDVQIVIEGDGVEWDSRDRVFDEEGASGEMETADLALRDEEAGDKKKVDGARGMQDTSSVARGFDYDGRRSQSRVRSWTLDELACPRVRSKSR